MAKISARGATEVARIRAATRSGTEWLYVLCSDGRVLTRLAAPGESYGIRARIGRDQISRDRLASIVQADGLTEMGGA
jgi:hypothetical protein